MKVVLITPVTPTKDNINGPTAHPYHILVGRTRDIDVTIYSFNSNKLKTEEIKEVERTLDVKIKIMEESRWIKWVIRYFFFVRVFLKYPIGYYKRLPKWAFDEITEMHPDGIWVYGLEMNRCIQGVNQFKVVNMLSDCESLYYYRMMGQRFVFNNAMNFIRQALMYRKYIAMEKSYITKNVRYSLVGREDTLALRNVHPGIEAYFVHHPHYDIYEPKKQIKFSSPRIKIVLAGRNDLYMNQSADEFTKALCEVEDIADKFDFTYLGKGWEQTVCILKRHGYHVQHIPFAEDYKKELCNHDIQFTPICIGTGTKGKVLDALANGLLVLGTNYAMENIEVINGESCLVYGKADEAIYILRDIAANPEKYEQMAEKGRQCIFKHHNRQQAAKEFFNLFR